jgi:anaerobic magnesium-protoporphyrin IX monomethyl ester cyclase
MKAVLIAPPYPLEEAPSPPLGICYVAAAFEAAGADVRIFDYIVRGYSPEKLKNELDAFMPDVVGTNAVTMNFYAAAGILKTAKQHNPSLITLMGGPHVSFDFKDTLHAYPEIDLIVIGEGEETLKELIPVIQRKEAWHDIKGLAFMENGRLVVTGHREFISDLDTLPMPARHLLPVSRYLALGFPVSIITSRGCPNHCIFCQGRRMVGMKVRYRSPKSVADEMENILSYGFKRINIADDFFTSNKKRVKRICEEILNRGLKFSWSAFARVDSCNRDVLCLMRDAGCDTVSFGIESGNPEMLKRIKKGITLDQAREAIRLCKEVGMGVFLSFMVGLPGETARTLKDTRAFAEELDVPFGYHFLAPFPGTTLWEEIDRYDIQILTRNWDEFDANRAITRTSELSEMEINAFVEEFNVEVEKCWQEIKDRCAQGNCPDDQRLRLEGNRRMHLIFSLLSEDMIEKYGFFHPPLSSSDPAQALIESISTQLNGKADELKKTVPDLIAAGYLKSLQDGERIRWFWTHNRNIDVLPLFSELKP